MKNTKQKSTLAQIIAGIAVMAITIIGISSCSKSSSSNSTSPYTMSATKGSTNVSFSGSSNVIAFASGPLLEIEGFTASGADTTAFIFLIGNYTGVGTYTLDNMTNIGEYESKTSSSASLLFAANGKITIATAASPTMTGSFYFTATDSTKVTNGTFTAKY